MTNPTVMVLWHCPPIPYTPPILHPQQWLGVPQKYLVGSPFHQTERVFPLPSGNFDLVSLLSEHDIPSPDWLFVCLDATTPFFARNIESAARCRLLCLGDTHHLPSPLSRMLPYAASEPWNGIIFTNNIRHSHWFREVTDAEHFFEPAMFALDFRLEKSPFVADRRAKAMFYGQMGQCHPRRIRLMTPLLDSNLIAHVSGSPAELATRMSSAAACVNVTLNSDLNARVFEIAQTGTLQIIDNISVENGMGAVLINGHNCLAFSNIAELSSFLRDGDQMRNLAANLGSTLRREWLTHWGIHRIRWRVEKSMRIGHPSFLSPIPNPRLCSSYDKAPLDWRLAVYEFFLEVHRQEEEVEVLVEGKFGECYKNDFSDLPRLSVVNREAIQIRSNLSKYILGEKSDGAPVVSLVKVA